MVFYPEEGPDNGHSGGKFRKTGSVRRRNGCGNPVILSQKPCPPIQRAALM
jgi:hypothetical protein